MRMVVLAGPPCSGKTTLAHQVAQPGDVVLDYDDIARALGSPVHWRHPEPYRTQAEHLMQHRIRQAHAHPSTATAWILRTTPRPHQRAALAHTYRATVYLLNPGRRVCEARATTDHRPSGTRRAIGEWYSRYTPWVDDRDPHELSTVTHKAEGMMTSVDLGSV